MFNYDELFTIYNCLTSEIRKDEKKLLELDIAECERLEAIGENDSNSKSTPEMMMIKTSLDDYKKIRAKVKKIMNVGWQESMNDENYTDINS